MTSFIVLRPEPGASATAERIVARGGAAIVAPLFVIAPLAWRPPPAEHHDALMITSAHAVRQAGDALGGYRALPAYAVGAATAAVLRRAGFADVSIGGGDAEALIDLVAAEGRRRPLHLAGADYRPLEGHGIAVTRRIVYGARAVDRLPASARSAPPDTIALLHSPRAAHTFATLWDEAERPRSDLKLAAISRATRDAAGAGWGATTVAPTPDDAALLAAAFALCEDGAVTMSRRG